jgi:ubiquitin carboxyl-terminal hydrolase L3
VERQTSSDETYFLRQIEGGLSNACGTIALLHSVINSRSAMGLPRDSPALQFFDRTKDLTPDARGHALDSDETIAAIHNALVQQGDTAPLDAADVRHHYVAFVRSERGSGSIGDAGIIELDGYYKAGPQYHPIVHKPDCDDLLPSAVEVIKAQYMQRLDEASTFSVLLVVPKAQRSSSRSSM